MIAGLILSVAALGAFQAPAGTPPRLRSGYISNADYPREALTVRAEGSALIHLGVTPRGRVSGCRVVRSSGNQALDAASCRIGVERFEFNPARDATGRAVAGVYEQRFTWRLP